MTNGQLMLLIAGLTILNIIIASTVYLCLCNYIHERFATLRKDFWSAITDREKACNEIVKQRQTLEEVRSQIMQLSEGSDDN